MVSEQVLGTCTHWGDLGEGRLSGYKGSSESLRRACGRFVGNLPNADCSGWILAYSDITQFWDYYWHGPPPKPAEGVEVSEGGVPWRFVRSVLI